MNYPQIKMLVAGEWRLDNEAPVIDPFDEAEIGVRGHASESDLEEAIASARTGMRAWHMLGPAGREAIMTRAANILRERAEHVARVISMEQGKTVREALGEIIRAADIIEWDGHEGRRLYGRVIPAKPGFHNAVYRQPIGIVAAFAPWNFPIASPARKIGSALAAGCAVILKAAEETPGGAFELVRAFVDAGLPVGVINLLYGDPPAISQHLIAHPDIRMVTFTGSIPVGKQLTALAGAHMKPVVMELGGHSPVFVSTTADIDAAVDMAVAVKSVNAGQVCVSPTRFFVENPVYEQFAQKMADRAKSVRVGRGTDEDTQMGPLINARRLAAVEDLVADARSAGAQLLAGGERIGNRGFAYPLTILSDVPDTALAMREEPFGPVALLNRVSDVDEAIDKANALPYGLSGYAFTQSARDIHYLTEKLEVGNLAVNHYASSDVDTPFGGVKDSGIGREGGVEGPLNFTVVKTVLTYLG